ncbi:M14 family metallopeptidase [Aliidiomarina celeris]|uniref:M14 family metallopeptidase n=1 Tax=Aliidiomarina celeris TaxID=2249428 RepID=UPI000DEADC0D|nr:M14 family metallocarboxypeptidase [Aliidiomarina celeris]
MDNPYPIGTLGQPWQAEEKSQWLAEQQRQRSYRNDVLMEVETCNGDFIVHQYGELAYQDVAGKNYPLFVVKTRKWQDDKPTVLVTGGVHGYETSGVHGALRFLTTVAKSYQSDFNLVVAPCISPWGYETINRWNPFAVDPNRSFTDAAPAAEAEAIMRYVRALNTPILMHIDLHETTDTDNSEFRPALAARDGTTNDNWNIPDGFYLVGNSDAPEQNFQQAVLDSVAKVTHIAPADEHNRLIGEPIAAPGLIYYQAKKYGLCMGFTGAPSVTTTEVYPDSANATPEECIQAQVAAITGALDYLKALG